MTLSLQKGSEINKAYPKDTEPASEPGNWGSVLN